MTDVVIPHDPAPGGNTGDPCATCGETWPCPMRKAQRMVLKECRALLRSDLYDVDRRPDDGPLVVRWTSPLGLSVLLGYGAAGATATILTPDGATMDSTDQLTVGWLDRMLP